MQRFLQNTFRARLRHDFYLAGIVTIPGPGGGGALHCDTVSLQNSRDWSDGTRFMHREAQIIMAAVVWSRRGKLATCNGHSHSLVAGDIHDIGEHGAGGRQRTRALAEEKHFTNRIAAHQHRVVLVTYAG